MSSVNRDIMEISEMSESVRGCGYRKIGALYLVCDPGLTLECDGLPMPLEPCECCGFAPPFSRNLQKLNVDYVHMIEEKLHRVDPENDQEHRCRCPPSCPICYTPPYGNFGLMFVGKSFYTPREFIQEALNMGVSKRIPQIPKWLILGKTWILLAHNEVPKVTLEQLKTNEMHMKEPEKFRAVFYAFKPQRIELPVWKDEISSEEILLLEKKGITPILLDPTPKNKKKHGRAKNRKVLMRLLKPEPEEKEK